MHSLDTAIVALVISIVAPLCTVAVTYFGLRNKAQRATLKECEKRVTVLERKLLACEDARERIEELNLKLQAKLHGLPSIMAAMSLLVLASCAAVTKCAAVTPYIDSRETSTINVEAFADSPGCLPDGFGFVDLHSHEGAYGAPTSIFGRQNIRQPVVFEDVGAMAELDYWAGEARFVGGASGSGYLAAAGAYAQAEVFEGRAGVAALGHAVGPGDAKVRVFWSHPIVDAFGCELSAVGFFDVIEQSGRRLLVAEPELRFEIADGLSVVVEGRYSDIDAPERAGIALGLRAEF